MRQRPPCLIHQRPKLRGHRQGPVSRDGRQSPRPLTMNCRDAAPPPDSHRNNRNEERQGPANSRESRARGMPRRSLLCCSLAMDATSTAGRDDPIAVATPLGISRSNPVRDRWAAPLASIRMRGLRLSQRAEGLAKRGNEAAPVGSTHGHSHSSPRGKSAQATSERSWTIAGLSTS